MGQLLSYSIVSGIVLLALYLAYRLFLAGENQHGFNRTVLLGIYAIAFTAVPAMKIIQGHTSTAVSPTIEILELQVNAVTTGPEASQQLWCTALIWLYIAGMAIVALKTIAIWVKLLKIIRSGRKIDCGGYTLVITGNKNLAPFSWMHYVVINSADYAENSEAIIAHETRHIAARHWLDLLVAQAVCMVNWFNPAAWLMRDELMLVHEYQADMAVIDSGQNPRQYQMLLIKKAVGSRFPSLANSLNHSSLKKRITMMYKEKSGAGRRFKALALVPVLAVALAVSAVPAVRAAVSTIGASTLSTGKSSENTASVQAPVATAAADTTPVLTMVEQLPQYPGGERAIMSALMSKLTFPNPDRQWPEGASGRTVVEFKIMPDGTMDNIRVLRSCGFADLDAIAVNAVGEALTERWTPGMNAGRPVAVSYTLPVSFKTQRVAGSQATDVDEMEIFVDGQKMDRAQLNAISPERIASMTVDRKGKRILVTLKTTD